jgi:hypothetical protein
VRAVALKPTPCRDGTYCHDCGVDTLPVDWGYRAEWYMVTQEVWDVAGLPGRGFLCIGCMENRLGRQLVASDFTDCPINDLHTADTQRYAWSYRTPRLTSRLRAV